MPAQAYLRKKLAAAGERLEGDTLSQKGQGHHEELRLRATHTVAGALRNSMGGTSMRSKEWKKHHVHDDPSLYAACCLTGNNLTGTG